VGVLFTRAQFLESPVIDVFLSDEESI